MKLLYLLKSFGLLGLTLFLLAGCAGNSGNVYKTVDALHSAIASASPGDTLIVANGEWIDADLLFEAEGTAEAPIVLMAEEPGKVVFTGASRLRLAGEYLVVSGLAFVDGHTPGTTVIEFRKNSKKLANNSRVTNCVIDNYNPKDRFKRDMWVTLYGKNNRFDHNTLTNKKNSGVTLVVRLNDPRSQENFHRIDHNFFGYRPRLGSNGGETLRVGVSTYSLSSSNTTIEDNYFYKCNGETEVASIKASDNIVRRNTFYECEGSLVMRHGDRNIVSENFFIGNDLPETGGVRVINNGHKIFNNYFYGLKGERFRSALAVMNGVPNSLLNRYHKAKDCIIANNTFINCDNIELGVGSDFERTDVPENILIANNIFLHERSDKIYQVLDDISGITFKTNIAYTSAGPYRSSGFLGINPALKKVEDGLLVPTSSSIAGFALQQFDFIKTDITGKERTVATAGALQLDNSGSFKPYVGKENTGVKWYTPKSDVASFGSGKTHAVASGEELYDAVSNSEPGDVVELTGSGDYNLTETLVVKHPLTIRAKAGMDKRPLLLFVGEGRPYSFIAIENGGRLQVDGLAFDGNSEKGSVAESAIRTSRDPMIEHYSLFVNNCHFYDFQESRHNAFKAFKSTFGDTVSFTNCLFNKISGTALSMSWEKEDRGKYSAEYVILRNNVFQNVMGEALNLYRGGNDESTFGPFLTVENCVFDYVNNKEQGSVLRLIGVQNASIANCIFQGSGRGGRSIKFEESRWNHVRVSHCNLYQSGKVESFYPNVVGQGMLSIKPEFVDAASFNYQLKPGSPLLTRGENGKPIGLAQN